MEIPKELKSHIKRLRASYPGLSRREFRKALQRTIKDKTWKKEFNDQTKEQS